MIVEPHPERPEAEVGAPRPVPPAPCGHPARVERTTFGRISGYRLAHAACTQCAREWWESDRRPVPFPWVAGLLAAHYEALTGDPSRPPKRR